jgi:hypothetical protein
MYTNELISAGDTIIRGLCLVRPNLRTLRMQASS